ncbi:MAG TPA: RDD family protein [Propionibacteriaceae bacterium]|nr:RDD family protein [Propionibacteriaceae bacterium]
MSARTTTPVPVTGLPPGVHTGPLGARLAAQLIDLVVPAVLLVIVLSADLPAGAIVLLLLLIVTWLLLVGWMAAGGAASPGMRLMKLQVVGLRDGRPVGWSRLAIREVVLAALTVTIIGLLAMLFLLAKHPRRQGWHDLLAGSVVIKQRALAPPRPARRTAPQDAPLSATAAPERPAGAQLPTPLAPPAGPAREPSPALAATAASSGSRRLEPPSEASASRVTPRAEGAQLSQGWRAVLDDGRALAVTGLVLLGRNPQGRPGEEDAELIKVTDETRTVSKTHLAMGVDTDGLFVMDRGSTNGSTLTDTSGASTPCYPGDTVSVPEGSIVSFGNHWLRVERHLEG